MKYFNNLSARERRLIVVGVIVLAGFSVFQFLWLPAQAERQKLAAQISDYYAVQTAAANYRPSANGASTANIQKSGTLSTRLVSSAEAANLSVSRLEPEGARMRLTFGEVPFPSFISWVSKLQKEQSVIIVDLDLNRRPQPGVVSASIVLEQRQ